MLPFGEAATRALARQQAENLARFLLRERAHSAQLLVVAAATVGEGPEAAREFLAGYVDEMAAVLVESEVFPDDDAGRRQLDTMLTSLAHGLLGALRAHAWAASAVNDAVDAARVRYVYRAPWLSAVRDVKVA